MNEHLRGPWCIVERATLEDGSVYPRYVSTVEGDYQICLLESANMAAMGYDRTPTELAKDRLIAAAPDLLEALQELASAGAEAWGDDRPCVREALAAIAKATRSQP